MSIKVEAFIKLPYIMRLKEEKDYSFDFIYDDFELFHLDIMHNSENLNEYYDERFPINSSNHLRIETVYNNCDHNKYRMKKGLAGTIIEVPQKERIRVLEEINKKLNSIFYQIREKTNMFWVESLPSIAINYLFDYYVEYNFYEPSTVFSCLSRGNIAYLDQYMLSDEHDDVRDIDENLFCNYSFTEEYAKKYMEYMHKAQKSLHDRNYEDCIIYGSISVESFIRKYIDDIKPENDIIFNRLSSSNYDYIDQYYNVLLKCLKGISLNEKNPGVYNNLVKIYKIRNGIMHKGSISKETLKKAGLGHLDYLNFKECENILDNIKEAFKLIKEL